MPEATTIGTASAGAPAGDVSLWRDGVSKHFCAFGAGGGSAGDEPVALAAAAGSQPV